MKDIGKKLLWMALGGFIVAFIVLIWKLIKRK